MSISATHDMADTECVRCGGDFWSDKGKAKLAAPCPNTDAEVLVFLKFFYDEADNAMGPASDDIYYMIAEDFRETGKVLPGAFDPRRYDEEEE